MGRGAEGGLRLLQRGRRPRSGHGAQPAVQLAWRTAVTADWNPGGRPVWFHSLPSPGPEEAICREARRWHQVMEERERLLRCGGGREGEGRWPAPAPGTAVGFWSPLPVLGYRFWYVFSGCLQGVRQTWLTPELEARCARPFPGAPHADGGCGCGIYALKSPERLPRPERIRLRPGAGIAYGLVTLSGLVVEHERGYRAARATAAAAAVLFRGRGVCGADRCWIERLFRQPDCALEEAEMGRWRRVRPIVASAEEIVRFLHEEASKLETAWTSASRSE
jgi:hypothetical protein